jgi:hypothetical protein
VVGGVSKKGIVWGQGELGPLLLSQTESTSTSHATPHVDSTEVTTLQTRVANLTVELGENREQMLSYIQMNVQRFQQVVGERDQAITERDEARAALSAAPKKLLGSLPLCRKCHCRHCKIRCSFRSFTSTKSTWIT